MEEEKAKESPQCSETQTPIAESAVLDLVSVMYVAVLSLILLLANVPDRTC